MPRNNRRPAAPVAHAHPAVVDLYNALREQDMQVYRLAEKAGVDEVTIWAWFRKATCPQLPGLEATLNVVGLTLTTAPKLENKQ